MSEESAKLRIPLIAAAQAQKHVTHNEGVTLLDTLVQLSVLDKDLVDPPGSPAEGDTYIVAGAGGSATGAWTGWDKRVARHIDGEWRSYLPGQGNGAGWLAWVLDEDTMYRFDGTNWDAAGIEGPQGAAGPAGTDGADGADGADGEDGQSFQPDVAVPLIAGRAAYDDEAAAFSVLVVADSTNGDQPTLYFKLSVGSADWSDPITWVTSGGGSSERIGIPFKIRAATPPDGAFEEDGSVIEVATYPEFVAVAYCGDGENATADYHYRCTNPANPTNTRSTSGAYFVLCDARGEFERGWDNGRGVDPGRSLWEVQLGQTEEHHHPSDMRGNGTSRWGANTTGLPSATNRHNVTTGGTASIGWPGGPMYIGSVAAGGSETRGRGVASLACIYYE